ncbi:hypothetical protein Ac2012v2_003933, partial [Leucoagaricus gongylophorus]
MVQCRSKNAQVHAIVSWQMQCARSVREARYKEWKETSFQLEWVISIFHIPGIISGKEKQRGASASTLAFRCVFSAFWPVSRTE